MGVVATPLRFLRSARVHRSLAVIALGYLVVMYVAGRPPTHQNLILAENTGLLELAPEKVVAVELLGDGDSARYQKESSVWRDGLNDRELDASDTELLARAIMFLHTATPVRRLRPEQFADVGGDPFGLEQPTLTIRLFNLEGVVLVAKFGNRGNDGVLQYLQIEGDAVVYLMSGFVGDAWRQMGSIDPPGGHH